MKGKQSGSENSSLSMSNNVMCDAPVSYIYNAQTVKNVIFFADGKINRKSILTVFFQYFVSYVLHVFDCLFILLLYACSWKILIRDCVSSR